MEKYKNNIAYLFKRSSVDNTLTYSTEGLPFYCNKVLKKTKQLNAMTGIYIISDTEIIKTSTDMQRKYGVSFEPNDKIAFSKTPSQDDYSMIIEIEPKSYLEKGNKHRSREYYEYWITIS